MLWSHSPKVVLKSPVHLIAFGFGSGLPGKAPGTWGSLGALAVYALVIGGLPLWLQWLLVSLGFALGVYLTGLSAERLGVKDHPGIVWDEWIGLWLALSLLPNEPIWWLIGFVGFRVFDIAKPGPIGWLDKRLGGGLGIMTDDLLAGLITGLLGALGLVLINANSLA